MQVDPDLLVISPVIDGRLKDEKKSKIGAEGLKYLVVVLVDI